EQSLTALRGSQTVSERFSRQHPLLSPQPVPQLACLRCSYLITPSQISKSYIPSDLVLERCSYALQPSGGEDLEVEEPVSCWDFSSFDFHPTLTSVLGASLVRHEVIEMGQPSQKGLWAPLGVMKAFHHE